MKVCDVIFAADFHDLCSRQIRNFVGNLSRTLSQSRRNGIWAKPRARVELREFLRARANIAIARIS